MSDSNDPIVFTRSYPTSFVLLLARVGPGTNTVDPVLASRAGAQSLKPTGTEYATREDLIEAGFLPAGAVAKALRDLRAMLELQATGSQHQGYVGVEGVVAQLRRIRDEFGLKS